MRVLSRAHQNFPEEWFSSRKFSFCKNQHFLWDNFNFAIKLFPAPWLPCSSTTQQVDCHGAGAPSTSALLPSGQPRSCGSQGKYCISETPNFSCGGNIWVLLKGNIAEFQLLQKFELRGIVPIWNENIHNLKSQFWQGTEFLFSGQLECWGYYFSNAIRTALESVLMLFSLAVLLFHLLF